MQKGVGGGGAAVSGRSVGGVGQMPLFACARPHRAYVRKSLEFGDVVRCAEEKV